MKKYKKFYCRYKPLEFVCNITQLRTEKSNSFIRNMECNNHVSERTSQQRLFEEKKL